MGDQRYVPRYARFPERRAPSGGRTKKLALAFVISLVPFVAQADIADVFRQFDHGTPAD
jgi:hypothetical protein